MYPIIEKIFDHNSYRVRVMINMNTEETIFLNYDHDPTQEEVDVSVNSILNTAQDIPVNTVDSLSLKVQNLASEVSSLNPSISGQRVSARQVRIWLVRNGISLDYVENAIDSITDPIVRDITKVEWEYAPYIERTHPMLPILAQALGLNENILDQAFTEASEI